MMRQMVTMISGPTGAATLSLLSTMPHQPALAEAFRNGPLAVWRHAFEQIWAARRGARRDAARGSPARVVAETTSALLVQRWLLTGGTVDEAYADEVLDTVVLPLLRVRRRPARTRRLGPRAHQPSVPGSPLNGPTTSSVIQPP